MCGDRRNLQRKTVRPAVAAKPSGAWAIGYPVREAAEATRGKAREVLLGQARSTSAVPLRNAGLDGKCQRLLHKLALGKTFEIAAE